MSLIHGLVKNLSGLFLAGFILLLSACEKNEEWKVETTTCRTVLLYMIADNDLNRFVTPNIDEIMAGMEQADNYLNMLIYDDSQNSSPTLWKIERNKQGQIVKVPQKIYEEQNSTDPKVIQSVLTTAFDLYPASEKGLILWSHGSGWVPGENSYTRSHSSQDQRKRSIGPDNDPTSDQYLEIWELRDYLTQTDIHFDFIIFDACLMASVEVAYELRNQTDYLIASPTEIMGEGFPYRSIMPLFCRNVLDLPAVCDAYMAYYNGATLSYNGSISLIKTAHLEELLQEYKNVLAEKKLNIAILDPKSIQQLGRRIGYNADFRDVFYDLQHFTETLNYSDIAIFQQLISLAVVKKGFTEQFGFPEAGGEIIDIRNCCGLTVFIPELSNNQQYINAYHKLEWYQATQN